MIKKKAKYKDGRVYYRVRYANGRVSLYKIKYVVGTNKLVEVGTEPMSSFGNDTEMFNFLSDMPWNCYWWSNGEKIELNRNHIKYIVG